MTDATNDLATVDDLFDPLPPAEAEPAPDQTGGGDGTAAPAWHPQLPAPEEPPEAGAILGIPGDALRRRYPGELARGRALGELAIASCLRRRMEKGNAAALIYMAKAKLGWPEKPKEEHADSGGDDATRRYLAMPEAERLAHLRVLAARVLGPAPDPEADGFERG